MALDKTEIRDIARDILYGTGLGEKPSLRVGSGTATVTGSTAVFDVDDGDLVRPGDILTNYGATSTADAYSFYILSISTDTVTCVNGYEGAAIANGASVAGMIFEVMPLVSQWKIYESIDVIIDRFLWPEVFDITQDTATPDLTTGQVDLDSADEEILNAWQVIGSETVPVSFYLQKNMSTTLFASGNMGAFDFIDASTLYYSAKRRVTASSTGDTALLNMIGTGAAAVCLGGTVVETTLDSSKKDSQERGGRDVGLTLWRDFMSQKQLYSEDLSRDTVQNFVIERN